MSTENNTMKIDDEKIKEVLRHHQDLTRQIHEQVIDIRKKIDEVKQQCLEIASYPKIDFNVESRGSGYYKDLTDVYLKYQKFIQTQEKELANEMYLLTEKAESIHRLYLCFQALGGEEYEIINRLYIKGELYKSAEKEMGLSHRAFEFERKRAIKNIQHLLDCIKYAEYDKERAKEVPEEYDEEELSFIDGDIAEWEEKLHDMRENWEPETEPNMGEEIERIKKWVEEKEELLLKNENRRPQTIEQFHIKQWIDDTFVKGCLRVEYTGKDTAKIMDNKGDIICVEYKDGEVRECQE